MTDWVTISSLATAGGTLVLAVATFSSVRSSNRAARVAERSLLAGLRPMLIPSRDEDGQQTVRFGDAQMLVIAGHGGTVEVAANGNLYLGLGLRNGGTGLAVIHGWQVLVFEGASAGPPEVDQFRRQQRDLYIPARETGFWQGAMRERSDPGYETVRSCVEGGSRLGIDVLYGDYEGGQRTIARFGLSTRMDGDGEPGASDGEHVGPSYDEPATLDDGAPAGASSGGEPANPDRPVAHEAHYAFRAEVVRYFNVDLDDPR
ncbi:MAG: hypothetical protein ACR2L9_12445 [Solirubrobacteraceae bacterium]